MSMIEQYNTDVEKKRNQSAIQILARDPGMPVKEIASLYEETFEKLNKEARIKDDLSILASRRVKDVLQPRKVA